MANGTIAFDTLSTSGQISGTAVSVDADYLAYGSAKCWCLFNGTGTIAIRDSFNASGLTDVGTGIYQVAYSNNTASANTVTSGSNVGDPTTANRTNAKIAAYGSVSTSTTYISVTINDGSYLDFTHVGITVNGDLA